jgi:hypothetical protein
VAFALHLGRDGRNAADPRSYIAGRMMPIVDRTLRDE